jgi:hypothetical protein
MGASFMRWFLGGALLVSGLHAGEALSLILDSPGSEAAAMFAVVSDETAAESRS